MGLTNFPNGVSSFGIPQVGASVPTGAGNYWFVDTENGVDGNSGKDFTRPFATVDRAMDFVASGDTVLIAPGEYDEAITVAHTLNNVTFVGCGGRGSVFIAPATAAAVAMTNHADDVTIINVGLDGNTTGAGLINTGARLRVYGSKLEGDDIACQMTLGTVAQETAGTRGTGGDCLFYDCEFAWAAKGVLLTCTDYGGVTQLALRKCKFHNLATAAMDESVGSGGSAAVLYFNLEVSDCVFDDAEDGTAPTAFLLLNDNNANTGIATRNSFPSAINSGKNLVSTAFHWVCNYHTGGVSTGQPS